MSLGTALFLALIAYISFVRSVRFRRLKDAQARFHRLKKAGALDSSAAQEIAHTALLYDMPFFSRLGAQVALFKTYGIPSIAELLLKTGELTHEKSMSKRVTDTAILISSFIMCPLTGRDRDGGNDGKADPRGCLALARMNWLHHRYHIVRSRLSVFFWFVTQLLVQRRHALHPFPFRVATDGSGCSS
ncbi:hypothetical protein PM082_013842 [Marasmius tenuissimus]|nr:hypothetical protein PM082_013842 [Marasmius tenuissimus]